MVQHETRGSIAKHAFMRMQCCNRAEVRVRNVNRRRGSMKYAIQNKNIAETRAGNMRRFYFDAAGNEMLIGIRLYKLSWINFCDWAGSKNVNPTLCNVTYSNFTVAGRIFRQSKNLLANWFCVCAICLWCFEQAQQFWDPHRTLSTHRTESRRPWKFHHAERTNYKTEGTHILIFISSHSSGRLEIVHIYLKTPDAVILWKVDYFLSSWKRFSMTCKRESCRTQSYTDSWTLSMVISYPIE